MQYFIIFAFGFAISISFFSFRLWRIYKKSGNKPSSRALFIEALIVTVTSGISFGVEYLLLNYFFNDPRIEFLTLLIAGIGFGTLLMSGLIGYKLHRSQGGGKDDFIFPIGA